jgi:hypothetical protein
MELEKQQNWVEFYTLGDPVLSCAGNIGWNCIHWVFPPCPVQEHWVVFYTLGDPVLSCAGTLGAFYTVGILSLSCGGTLDGILYSGYSIRVLCRNIGWNCIHWVIPSCPLIFH